MKLTRRWFLRGTGAALAIPVLPSLLTPAEARAQAAAAPRFFVNLGTHHGAVWQENLHPVAPAGLVQTRAYAGRDILRFPLAATVSGGTASLSPVLSAPATQLTPGLLQKMFTLRGLDVPWYLAHHTGGHLGNFARNDANGSDGALAQTEAQRRTIDQIMGWSPTFYPDLSGVRERVLVLTDRTSYTWSNPAAGTGTIQEISPLSQSPEELFNRLFPSTAAQPRPLIVDKVLENYRRVRSSPRLSAADKVRLDDHLQRIDELQRRVNTMASCARPASPQAPYARATFGDVRYNPPWARDPAEQAAWYRVLNDLIVAAFSCGLSRVAVGLMGPALSDYAGDWHQDVAHQALQPDGVRQTVLWNSYQVFFRGVLLDLAAKMDAVTMPSGGTLLDQSLVVWSQESGLQTHETKDTPVVGFGSAGGFLQTGFHIDYRDRTRKLSTSDLVQPLYPGLLWHQWLGTVLQSMGLPKSEYENAAVNGGYPDYNFMNLSWASITAAEAWPPAVWAAAGEPLPWLKA